jgi:hypothetical protein
MKTQKKIKKINAWAVVDCEYHCHFENQNGFPMIYIQKTKPKLWYHSKLLEVIPITITYNV